MVWWSDFSGFPIVENDFLQLKLLTMFFTERQTVLARYRIFVQREHPIRCDVQEPGECSEHGQYENIFQEWARGELDLSYVLVNIHEEFLQCPLIARI
jgi:hypothetical protein